MTGECYLRLRHVTCNYDGKDKFRTTIGDASIGCNTNLVARSDRRQSHGRLSSQRRAARALGIAGSADQSGRGPKARMEAYIAKKQKLEKEQNQ